MKPEILLMGPLIPHAMAQLDAEYTVHRYDLATDKSALVEEIAPRVTAIATRGDYLLDDRLMKSLPKLKVVASSGAGYDGIDVASARGLGIAVTNSPGAASECVADAAFALLLAVVRRTVANDKYVRDEQWPNAPVPLTDKVWGERLGIIGLGGIGQAIARRGEAFRMEIAYHGRREQPGVAYRYHDSPLALAKDVKFLVVAAPGTRGTPLVTPDVIDALGPGGYLVNVSRGSNVDESYLVEALVNRRLAGAALDVFADEPRVPKAFFELDNVVLSPHAESGTHATRNALGQYVVDNLAAFFAGKPLLSPV